MIVIDATETLLSRPRLQQGSIDGEVLIRELVSLACLFEDGSEESIGDVAIKQALAVLRKHRGIPNRVVHIQSHEPPEQQVVIQLLQSASVRCVRNRALGAAVPVTAFPGQLTAVRSWRTTF